MKTKRKLILLGFLIFLLIACEPKMKIEALSGSQNCQLPCWMNINPGITTKNEATSLLEQYEENGEGTLSVMDTGTLAWQSKEEKNFYFRTNGDEIVSLIDLDFRLSSISLQEIIEKFGEPSNIRIEKIRDGFFIISIYYPKSGLLFVGSGDDMEITEDKLGLVLEPNIIIIKGIFYPPSNLEEMINYIYGQDNYSKVFPEIQEWKGYGIYQK